MKRQKCQDEKEDSHDIMEMEMKLDSSFSEMLFQKIRVKSANGEMIEHNFKVFVESVPVSSPSNETKNDSNDELLDLDANRDDQHHQMVTTETDTSLIDAELSTQDMQTESLSIFSSQSHPLTVNEILENISKYLPFKDLVAQRLISTKWNYAFLPQLKRRCSAVRLYDHSKLCKFLTTMSKTQSQQVPITKFDIYDYKDCHLNENYLNDINTLFKTYGNLMTYLQLSIRGLSTPFNSTWFRNLLTNLLDLSEFRVEQHVYGDHETNPSRIISKPFWSQWSTIGEGEQKPLPMLFKLKIIRLQVNGLQGEEAEAFLTDFFNAAPNLDNLQVFHTDVKNSDHNQASLIALKAKKTLNKLKCLGLGDVTFNSFNGLIDLSINHGLSLTVLTMYLFNPKPQENVKLLKEFLMLQANCLKHLHIHNAFEMAEFRGEALVAELPSMAGLEELSINYNTSGITLQPSHETSFPQLKKLVFINDDDEWNGYDLSVGSDKWKSFTDHLCPLLTLQQLTIKFCLTEPDEIKQLYTLFPNLIKLDIFLSDIRLTTNIWTQWPKLEILSISHEYRRFHEFDSEPSDHDSDEENKIDDGLLDEIFTGISMEYHKLLDPFLPTNPLAVLNIMKSQPGVSDMKCLNELNLSLDNSPRFINDISVYYGFGLPDTKIKSIYVASCANKISRRCFEIIQKSAGSGSDIRIYPHSNNSD